MPDHQAIRRAATEVFCGALALLGTACTASVTASTRPRVLYSHPVTYVEAPPPQLHDSPRVYYRGRPAYWVGSRWYYPAGGDWVYFEREPPELRRARAEGRLEPGTAESRRRYAEPRRYRQPERRSVEPPREVRRRRRRE